MQEQIVEYNVTDAAIAEMEHRYMQLIITDLNDKKELDAVHSARMIVRKKRLEVERRRKELKVDALTYGRKVDSEAKRIFKKLEPIESHLMAEQNKVIAERKRIEEEKAEKKRVVINARINSFLELEVVPSLADVESMTDDEYHAEIIIAETQWNDKQARIVEEARLEKERREKERLERKAEEKRLAEERAENERVKKALEEKEAAIRVEQEREKKVQKEREAAIRGEQERIEKEQAKIAATFKAEQEAKEKRLAEERAEIEAEKRKIEAAKCAEQERKDREEFERKTQEEAQERAAKEAVEKAEREAAEVARQEALKPDKERLLDYAGRIDSFALEGTPEITDVDLSASLESAVKQIRKVANFVRRIVSQA